VAAAGLVTIEEVSRAISILEDPSLIWAMPAMMSAWRRKSR
jgi:hypothetical protein